MDDPENVNTASFKTFFFFSCPSLRQSYFERMVTYFEDEDGGLDHEIEFDRATARIIVDEDRKRGESISRKILFLEVPRELAF